MRNILRFRVVAIVLLALGLFAGTFANVGAQATPVASTGTLVVSKFDCPNLEEATATVSDPVPFVSAGGADTSECVAGFADFQVFANADFESEPVAEFEAGQASVDLAVGTGFALLEVDTNVFFLFDITADAITTITVLNPVADKDGATPVPGDKDGDGKDDGGEDKDGGDGGAGEDKDSNGDGVVDDKDTGDAGSDDGGAAGEDGAAGDAGADGANGADGTDGANGANGAAGEAGVSEGKGVSVLPSTGQGADAGTSGSAIVLLLGAMSLVALTAGFAWRQRRTA